MKLFTIGYTHKPLRRSVELLRDAEVDVVVDVRLRNRGQLAGWAKRDDLAFILETFGIAYRHRIDLAPTPELLERYRSTRDWDRYAAEYAQLIDEREVLPELQEFLGQYRRPCLLCSEHEPTCCHRRLLADELVKAEPTAKVVHLI